MCMCYLFSAKTAWQLVNRKADFFYKTNQFESIRIANRIDSNHELECSTVNLTVGLCFAHNRKYAFANDNAISPSIIVASTCYWCPCRRRKYASQIVIKLTSRPLVVLWWRHLKGAIHSYSHSRHIFCLIHVASLRFVRAYAYGLRHAV